MTATTTEQLYLAVERAKARRSAAQRAATATPSSFDTAEAVGFLDQVFGEVNSGRLGLSRLTSRGMQSDHFQWLRSGVAQAQKWDEAHPAGIYFRTSLLPSEGVKKGRGGEADAYALTSFWADVDYGTVGHKPGPNQLPLPPDEEAGRKIIAALPLPPSLLIHSGGGLYPIWQFERPIFITDANRAEVKARSQRWQEIIRATAGELGWYYGSGVGDLARVLRLPGSINRKVPDQPRPCRVIEQSGEVFSW